VVIEHVMPIALGGIGARTLVKHGLDIRKLPLGNPLTEIVFMQIVGNLPVDQIHELIAFGQVVDHQNIGIAALIQAAHNITADKAGSSGYHDHDSSPAVTTDVPSLPTTTPPARLAHKTASNQL